MGLVEKNPEILWDKTSLKYTYLQVIYCNVPFYVLLQQRRLEDGNVEKYPRLPSQEG
jgi:hypothetical protein